MGLAEHLARATSRVNGNSSRAEMYNENYLTPYALDVAQIAMALRMTIGDTNIPLNNAEIKLEIRHVNELGIKEMVDEEFPKIYGGQVSLKVEHRDSLGGRSLSLYSSLSNGTHDSFDTYVSHEAKFDDPFYSKVNDGRSHYKTEKDSLHTQGTPEITEGAFNAVIHFVRDGEMGEFLSNLQMIRTDANLLRRSQALARTTSVTKIDTEQIQVSGQSDEMNASV